MDRRQFLRMAILGGGAAVMPWLIWRENRAFAANKEFDSPLGIPPLLDGRLQAGRREFDLTLQHGVMTFFEGYKTSTIGINGPYLGPVIRARRGETVRINVVNKLVDASTLHWHGLRVPGLVDGGPHQSVKPGESWNPEFTIHQPASTQWYHSHAWHRTGAQVYQGLAGLFYLDDDETDALNLPNEYGVDDIPVVLQDRAFDEDGNFRYVTSMHQRMAGMLGNVMVVNGTVGAQFKARRRRMRLRILNGSNARLYNLRFSDDRVFHQIASDGGLLEHAVPMKTLRLAAGERAEILVDIAAGDDVMLGHTPLDLGGGRIMPMMAGADAGPYEILRVTADHQEKTPGNIPDRLAEIPVPSEKNVTATREFVLGTQMMHGSFINGRQMDMKRIDHRVKQGEDEIWVFRNDSPMPHPMHIHGTQFRVVGRSRSAVPVNEQGYKDTVLVLPDETVRVLARFDDPADEKHPFMFHCHNLEHEDTGMMGQFTVEA